MSGPPYPRGPTHGSNAIGSFQIGISPIGTIVSFDYWQTVLSQYANSEILMTMISNFFESIDQTANFDSFFDLIWNVDTAQGYGLDVWGRIVGVSRVVQLPTPTEYLGFDEAGVPTEMTPFNTAPFYSGQPTTDNFALSDSAYRVLIFAKALANISDGSIPSINALLMSLFPNQGNCYVTDGLDMTMTYTFRSFLTPVQLAIVNSSGVLPKPVGVSVTVVQGI